MQQTEKATRIADKALGSFRKIHDQLATAAELHEQAQQTHLAFAAQARSTANAHDSAATVSATDAEDLRRVQAKIAELVA